MVLAAAGWILVGWLLVVALKCQPPAMCQRNAAASHVPADSEIMMLAARWLAFGRLKIARYTIQAGLYGVVWENFITGRIKIRWDA
jgi:hypothetical protein